MSQICKIAHLCGNNLSIYSGNDDQILPVLSLGGIGVISVLSNIYPKVVHDICYNFFDKKIEIAQNLQLTYLPLINTLFEEVNPIPIKGALNLLGFDFGFPRAPLSPATLALRKKLKLLLQI